MQPQYAMNAVDNAPARTPISIEVAQFAHILSGRAQALADRLNAKLQPVMVSETERKCYALSKNFAEYPPLFAELLMSLQNMEGALESVEYEMDRTEL